MSKKRALWLINHESLRNFEVPLLIELGYEVFTPKIYQVEAGDVSASVEWSYDKTLTIPHHALEEMNEVDFYEDVPQHIIEYMNEYFDVVFFAAFPQQIKMLVRAFSGTLVFRPFGLEDGLTYTYNVIAHELGTSFLPKLEMLGDRFFFGQSYDNLAEIEFSYFKNRAISMPIGLKDAQAKNTWVGGDKKILFICPRINSNGYYNIVYKTFIKDFKGFDYLIGGAQQIPVNDPRVLGFLPKEQYEYNMRHLAAMFYHSREKRHIHYHPLEAIKEGMPLIYMSDGILDKLGGKDLPGRCKTIKEARSKLKRCINGDKHFIRKVTSSQQILLRHFDPEACKRIWATSLKSIEATYRSDKTRILPQKSKKIAVILPQPYTGGVLDYAIRFIKAAKRGAKECGDNIQFIFGYLDDPIFKERDYFKDLKNENITLRPFEWRLKDMQWAINANQLNHFPINVMNDEYVILDDGGAYFEDCDYLVFVADRVPGSPYCSKPYVVVAHDYIQRYVPGILGNANENAFLEFQRSADAVFVTTIPTYHDALQYAGLKQERVHLTPLLFDLVAAPAGDASVGIGSERTVPLQDYFVWSTNVTPHKNHKIMLEALSDYYAAGGRLSCFITGTNTHFFNSEEKCENITMREYTSEIRRIIDGNSDLKKNISVLGNLPKVKYLNILAKAKFFIHPGYADNGNGTAIDAACLRVPTISSDYPAMRYINNKLDLNMRFFDPFNPESIANALHDAENSYEEMAGNLPDRESLKKYTIEGSYQLLYSALRKLIY